MAGLAASVSALGRAEAWRAGHAQLVQWGARFAETLRSGQALKAAGGSAAGSAAAHEWPMALFLELTLLLFLANVATRALVVQPLARLLMLRQTSKPRKVTGAKVAKFAQSTLETVFYSAFFVMGWRVVTPQPWLQPSSQWWADQPDNRSIADDARFFYILYAARYMQNMVMVELETRRKDYLEMQIHHAVTVALIMLSYAYGFVRIGLVIMVLLDVADPPLHVAKQFAYLKDIRGPQKGLLTWSNAADLFFAIFAIVFTVTRMGMYPYVVWSVTVELARAKLGHVPTDLLQLKKYHDVVGTETIVCVALVWVLQFLQVFWWWLLVNVIIKVLKGSELKDNRSDSEQSDAESEDKKTQ
jgi:hypothetical protein